MVGAEGASEVVAATPDLVVVAVFHREEDIVEVTGAVAEDMPLIKIKGMARVEETDDWTRHSRQHVTLMATLMSCMID